MFYNADSDQQAIFLAGLDIQEEVYKQRLTKLIFDFLEQHVSLKTGSVISVSPHRNQYFSNASRFLVLQVKGSVARNSQTGKFSSILPLLVGVFLDAEGNPIQRPTAKLPEGTYETEEMSLSGNPVCDVFGLAHNTLHLVNLPNS